MFSHSSSSTCVTGKALQIEACAKDLRWEFALVFWMLQDCGSLQWHCRIINFSKARNFRLKNLKKRKKRKDKSLLIHPQLQEFAEHNWTLMKTEPWPFQPDFFFPLSSMKWIIRQNQILILWNAKTSPLFWGIITFFIPRCKWLIGWPGTWCVFSCKCEPSNAPYDWVGITQTLTHWW